METMHHYVFWVIWESGFELFLLPFSRLLSSTTAWVYVAAGRVKAKGTGDMRQISEEVTRGLFLGRRAVVGVDGYLSISSFSFPYYYYMFLGPAFAHLEIGGVMRFTLFPFFFFPYLFPLAWKVVLVVTDVVQNPGLLFSL